jgi:hypothetical protein
LQYWCARKEGLDASPALIGFFESPDGVAFLHRLVIAVQFVMTLVGPGGLRLVQLVLDLSGLGPFVANSFGSRQKLGVAMETQVRAYGAQQRERLSSQMPARSITVCEDETFHPAVCLVAIEPVSGFILVEQYAPARDEATWNAAMSQGLKGMPVRVVQSTSDEGKGLLAHVREGLGAHHSPDVFHVQHELCRGVSAALGTQVRRAEQALEAARTETEAQQAQAQAWPRTAHGPGRPPHFAQRIAQARAVEQEVEQALAQARARQERARSAVRGIGQVYHPVELDTGAVRSSSQAVAELEQHFDEIQAVADEAALPERCHKSIAKAHRLVSALGCTMAFFHEQVTARVAQLGLAPEQVRAIEQCLVPAAYLERAARKARRADERGPLRERAQQLRAAAHQSVPSLAGHSPGKARDVARVVDECADLFQRASSCVEGRNGQLSLRHHSLHRIAPTRLEALTVVHNYFLRRPDGTTAAQRFFGAPPDDLFPFLLDHLNLPARPAPRRLAQPTSPALN